MVTDIVSHKDQTWYLVVTIFEIFSTSKTKWQKENPEKLNTKQDHTNKQKQYNSQGSNKTKTLNRSERIESVDIEKNNCKPRISGFI